MNLIYAKPRTVKPKTLYSSRLQIQSISALFLYVLQGLGFYHIIHMYWYCNTLFHFWLATSSMYMRGYVIPFDLNAYLGT